VFSNFFYFRCPDFAGGQASEVARDF